MVWAAVADREKWSDLGRILKVELTGVTNGLNIFLQEKDQESYIMILYEDSI